MGRKNKQDDVWESLGRSREGRAGAKHGECGLRERQSAQRSWGSQESFQLVREQNKSGQLGFNKRGRSTVEDEVGEKAWGQVTQGLVSIPRMVGSRWRSVTQELTSYLVVLVDM